CEDSSATLRRAISLSCGFMDPTPHGSRNVHCVSPRFYGRGCSNSAKAVRSSFAVPLRHRYFGSIVGCVGSSCSARGNVAHCVGYFVIFATSSGAKAEGAPKRWPGWMSTRKSCRDVAEANCVSRANVALQTATTRRIHDGEYGWSTIERSIEIYL